MEELLLQLAAFPLLLLALRDVAGDADQPAPRQRRQHDFLREKADPVPEPPGLVAPVAGIAQRGKGGGGDPRRLVGQVEGRPVAADVLGRRRRAEQPRMGFVHVGEVARRIADRDAVPRRIHGGNALLQQPLLPFQRGDVGADRHDAAILGPTFRDQQGPAVGQVLLERFARCFELPETLGQCGLDSLLRHHLAGAEGRGDEIREDRVAGLQRFVRPGIDLPEPPVGDDDPAFSVRDEEAFRGAFDRVAQPRLRFRSKRRRTGGVPAALDQQQDQHGDGRDHDAESWRRSGPAFVGGDPDW